ncbi:apoptosis-inducing factor [Favolaschia claudopus]|uniref:Apoptosis-inducing factor n=1 Tax=Favolaschia claudopus TaxID=2862362 RepID=A0AAW0C8I5_9AGAR
MSAKKNDDRKSVVVVGGGHAGVNLARPLSAQLDASKYKLVLINPRPYRVLLPATLRMVVSDAQNLQSTALVPYDKLFHNGNGVFIQDSVRSMDDKVLTLGSGEQVPYDVLVLCSGMAWADPIAFPDTAEDVKSYISRSHEKFARAGNYLIVGGGAIGCELAGELKDIWPEREITLVHAERLLLNDTYTDRYRRRVADQLVARGIKIHLGDLVEDIPDHTGPAVVLTKGGLKLSTDLVVRAVGAPRPNTSFINSLNPDALTPAGFVKVKPTLQLHDYPNIFAAGDIVDWNEQKQAIKAQDHAKIVAKNIVNHFNGAPLKTYKTAFEAIFLTNGKNGGITYLGFLWGIIFGSWFTRLLKSRDLLVSRFRKENGL